MCLMFGVIFIQCVIKAVKTENTMNYPVIKSTSKRPYQVCKCCVMDTTDEDIVFDENGVCMRCNEYKERILPQWNHGKGHETELQTLINQCNSATVIPLEEYLQTDTNDAIDTNPANSTELFELKDTLAKAIDRLPEKERTVVSLYYYEELTLKEISLILHLTEARISQLHTKAIFRMRGYLAQSKEDLV